MLRHSQFYLIGKFGVISVGGKTELDRSRPIASRNVVNVVVVAVVKIYIRVVELVGYAVGCCRAGCVSRLVERLFLFVNERLVALAEQVGGFYALSRKYVVYGVVRVRARGKVIRARVDYIGLFAVRVVRREIFFVHFHRNRLRAAVSQHVRLGVAHKLDRSLFYFVKLVVFGIGLLQINFHHVLACRVADVFNREGNGVLALGWRYLKVGILELRIRKSVTERIGYGGGIIEITNVFRA